MPFLQIAFFAMPFCVMPLCVLPFCVLTLCVTALCVMTFCVLHLCVMPLYVMPLCGLPFSVMPFSASYLCDSGFFSISSIYRGLFWTNFETVYFRFDLSHFTFRLLNFVIDIPSYHAPAARVNRRCISICGPRLTYAQIQHQKEASGKQPTIWGPSWYLHLLLQYRSPLLHHLWFQFQFQQFHQHFFSTSATCSCISEFSPDSSVSTPCDSTLLPAQIQKQHVSCPCCLRSCRNFIKNLHLLTSTLQSPSFWLLFFHNFKTFTIKIITIIKVLNENTHLGFFFLFLFFHFPFRSM